MCWTLQFYHFIRETFASYIEGGDDSIAHAAMAGANPQLVAIKHDATKTKDCFIYPSQLFANVVKTLTSATASRTHAGMSTPWEWHRIQRDPARNEPAQP